MNKVKIPFLLLAAAALLGGLTACNNEVAEPQVPDNAVRLTASIGNPFSTRSTPLVNNAAQFEEGDEIYLLANEIGAGPDVYQAANTYRLNNGKWSPTDGKYILWKANELHFNAYYPASIAKEALEKEGILDNFLSYVPTDQSSKEKIAKADLMIMEPEANFKKTDPVNIQMQHKTVKVTVNIKGFKNEYEPGVKVENVRFVAFNSNPAITEEKTYLPYTESDGSINSSYTILLPYISATKLKELKVTMQPRGHRAVTADLSSVYGGTGYGKHYTVNVIVGKDRLEVGDVIVSDWSGSLDLPNGEATKQPVLSMGTAGYVIVNLDYAKDFDEVQTALAGYFALSAGQPEYKFIVKGSASKLFKDGHSVFHQTEATEIDLWDVTGITKINDGQFYGGAGGDNIITLKILVLPESVTSIGSSAFINHPSLESVICPNVYSISEEAFMGCTALKGIRMPRVRELKRGCFQGCTALQEVELRSDITEMGANAFTEEMAKNIVLKVQPFQKKLDWNENKQCGIATETDVEMGTNKPFGFGENGTKPLIWKEIKNINL